MGDRAHAALDPNVEAERAVVEQRYIEAAQGFLRLSRITEARAALHMAIIAANRDGAHTDEWVAIDGLRAELDPPEQT